jgi:hypothetical protein
MSITLAGAVQALLSGRALQWAAFGRHGGGTIKLATAAERRIFDFLFRQNTAQVVAGNEALFPGLIAAWKDTRDPAAQSALAGPPATGGSWRLHRIQTFGFGGLNQFGGEEFDLDVAGQNWCLEGQNGSGKTSLNNAVLWALTGQRVRERQGPVMDRGERAPVLDDQGNQVGTWPPLAAYPVSTGELTAEPEVSVRLTFVNDEGEVAEAFRKTVSPRHGLPVSTEQIDARIASALQLIEAGLLMPARLGQMGFGEGSHSLFSAVKRLTGLDQLSDIAQGVANQFAHNGRQFLRYAKEQRIELHRSSFDENIRIIKEKTNHLGVDLTLVESIQNSDIEINLSRLESTCSTEAAKQLDILKTEVAAALDLSKASDRERIRTSVATAKVLLEERTDLVPVFGAWTALTAAARHEKFRLLPTAIVEAEARIADALKWHRRQMDDRKLRMKAIAAEWFEVAEDPMCPLCDAELKTPTQVALVAELAALKEESEIAERRIGDVCANIDKGLKASLPEDVATRFSLLREMDPRHAYVQAMLERFVDREPFTDVLTGFAACVRDMLVEQERGLPEFDPASVVVAASAIDLSDEPLEVKELRAFIGALKRLLALADWWGQHRVAFGEALANVRGRPSEGKEIPERSIRGQIKRLEDALAKAEPYDDAAKRLAAALKAAKSWRLIQAEQKIREEIRDAMLPLKDLRLLVEVETARSIHDLSGRIETILQRIHLHERLAYRNAVLKKREVEIHGSLSPGMKIDASLVGNSSWLRAILWAFILALREETVRVLGRNPLPLLLLDDPQTTFDPRNKRKWAEELARIANLPISEPTGAQLILTTHEREFFVWLTELEKIHGQRGFIAPVNDSNPVATVLNGGCLERLWESASQQNNDATARSYIGHVRIHAEKLLKFMLRADVADIHRSNLEKLRDDLDLLRKKNVSPYNRRAFGELLKCLQSADKALGFIGDAHHSDSETLGVAQARDVHKFWQEQLEPKLYRALQVAANFAAFRGDGRTFAHEPCVVAWPSSRRDELRRAKLIHTGIAAAAQTDGRVGDGLLMIEEWTSDRLCQIHLPNHDILRLVAGTLEPVAAVGDMLIVSNYAQVHSRGLVVAAIEDRLLARRYNEMQAHPDIAVLTGQSIDPHSLAEPVIAIRADLQLRKVVGTLFESRSRHLYHQNEAHEVVSVSGTDFLDQLDGVRLFKVVGRSAEPLALDGQYLMTRDALPPETAVRQLEGRLVVAVDDNGVTYFKRMRCMHRSFVVLESLNSDDGTSAELLSLDGSAGLPRLAHALPVVGVLFELPGA